MEENEETGKKEFYKSGVKMRGDNETAYEQDLVSKGSWLAKMQEDKTQSFDLANYVRKQYAAYLKGGKRQPVDDEIPFFATPEPKDSNGQGASEAREAHNLTGAGSTPARASKDTRARTAARS